jgi:hypothetical protein
MYRIDTNTVIARDSFIYELQGKTNGEYLTRFRLFLNGLAISAAKVNDVLKMDISGEHRTPRIRLAFTNDT